MSNTKTSPGNCFEDFRIGQVLRHATPRTVTRGDISLYNALYGSRFAVQSSDDFAERIRYPEAPVDDLLVFHIVFGKTVPDISLNAVANLAYAGGRFLAPVYAGDTLSAVSEVIGLKENSNGRTGVVYVRSTGYNQDGTEVLDYVRWVMVNKRDPASPAPETVVPGTARGDRAGRSWRCLPPDRRRSLGQRACRLPASLRRLRGRRAHRPCRRNDRRGSRAPDRHPASTRTPPGSISTSSRKARVASADGWSMAVT